MLPQTVRRLVVKVGTSTLTDAAGRLDRAYIADLAAQLAAQRSQGRDVLLVTSGAIRAGRERLASSGHSDNAGTAGSSNDLALAYKQAAAAVGQGLLMHTYTEAFAWRGITVAQVLLTRDDLADRRRFLNARNTFRALFDLGVTPIVNENDTVAVDEIRFGDNDVLAARVAVLTEADLLLILSDVDGLYTDDSRSRVLATVSRITPELWAIAGDAESDAGTGGMRTKVEAAKIATTAGIRTVIARGRLDRVISRVLAGEPIGTTFLPSNERLRGRKRWIVAGSRPKGSITVNEGAAHRIRSENASLLPVGILEVQGSFREGDLVEIVDELRRRVARGIVNYSSSDLQLIRGLRTDQVRAAIGQKTHDEVIHRDNLVVDT
ncbi:MAG: glutamate 5-kinase [Chthonomonadales bacterium]